VARPHLSEIILQALKPALSQESAENLNFNELILGTQIGQHQEMRPILGAG